MTSVPVERRDEGKTEQNFSWGRRRRDATVDDSVLDEMFNLLCQGHTYSEIDRRLGLKRNVARNWIIRMKMFTVTPNGIIYNRPTH